MVAKNLPVMASVVRTLRARTTGRRITIRMAAWRFAPHNHADQADIGRQSLRLFRPRGLSAAPLDLMSVFVIASIALGIGVGLLVGLSATKLLYARSSNLSPVFGGSLAALPAMFLSIVIGGAGGGGFGESIFGKWGIVVGLALGIATVLGAGISLGALTGMAFGALFGREGREIK